MEQSIYQTARWYKNFLRKKNSKVMIKKQISEYFDLKNIKCIQDKNQQ